MSAWLALDSWFIPVFTGDIEISQTQLWPHRVHSLVGEERWVNSNGCDRVLDTEPGQGKGLRAGNFFLSSFKSFIFVKSDYFIKQSGLDFIRLCSYTNIWKWHEVLFLFLTRGKHEPTIKPLFFFLWHISYTDFKRSKNYKIYFLNALHY